MGILIKLDLIKKTDKGYSVLHRNLTNVHDVPNVAVRKVHRQLIEKAQAALETQAIEHRDITGMTMAISKKRLPQAKEMIRQFRRQLSKEVSKEEVCESYRQRLNARSYLGFVQLRGRIRQNCLRLVAEEKLEHNRLQSTYIEKQAGLLVRF